MTISNESLKEYYVKLQQMYENCFTMLTAIQQSLSTTASEITINVASEDGTEATVRVPSFLYLENKLEQLDNNFSNLFKMPDSGEAWFTKSSNMYKLNMVRSSSAPVTPSIISDGLAAGYRNTTILKDLVSPHTYLRATVENMPENASEMFMKKIVIYSANNFDAIKGTGAVTYDEWRAALYNYKRGDDYEEYDSTIKLPVKKDTYVSRFTIDEILSDPWVDPVNGNTKHLSYKLKLGTIEYTDEDDSSIRFTLKPGDAICLGDEMVVYTVKSVDTANDEVIIEEMVGHVALQTYEENSSMVLSLYNDNYGKYNYVDIPLEEDRFVVVFLGVLYNNVRSSLSDALVLDLNSIYMQDENGKPIYDSHGNPMTYMDYYEKYCTNIGDLILGLTEAAYPQLSNFTSDELKQLTESDAIKTAINSTVDTQDGLRVVPINKHLIDDTSTEDIINLHAQKNNIQAQLLTVNDNISQVYNTLTTTDFSQETANTFTGLQAKLTSYYTERTTLQKQLNSIIDSISAKSLDVSLANAKTKYRVRGVLDTSLLEETVNGMASKANVVGVDIEYKYKSTTRDTNTVTVINSSTFTDWNRQVSIDRARHLEFEENTRSWDLKFDEYKSTDNVIKWNQVDIPITPGEDVILRIRYKYNIGQPFVDIMSPWSDEFTIVFPPEYEEDSDVMSIIDTNTRDTIVAGFRDILMNEGYEEHITNKVVAGDQTFLHQPENIYSGFTTHENSLISLKDKLLFMSQDIEQYKSWVMGESNSKFDVYLQYDEQSALLAPNSINSINIYNTDHITGTFIKKKMNIVIKNTGTTRVNLYSIFPGNVDISLIRSDIDSYVEQISNYERVPVMISEKLALQNLGQWIYFRQTNPYTGSDIYMNTQAQRTADEIIALEGGKDLVWKPVTPKDYMMESDMQVLHGFRDRTGIQASYSEIISTMGSTLLSMTESMKMVMNAIGGSGFLPQEDVDRVISNIESTNDKIDKLINYDGIFRDVYNNWTDEDFFYVNTRWSKKTGSEYYDGGASNVYLMRYEDITGKNDSTGALVQLDAATNISNFLSDYKPKGFTQDTDFSGAFLYPDILSRQQISTAGAANDHVFIDEGESLSIPVVFEYYLDGSKTSTADHTAVTKKMYFDIKNSLIKNPVHYMIEITGHYDFTSTGDVYSNFANIDLEDSVTNNS